MPAPSEPTASIVKYNPVWLSVSTLFFQDTFGVGLPVARHVRVIRVPTSVRMGDPIVAERGSALYQTIASECDMITGRNVADKEKKKIFLPEIGKIKVTEQFSTLHQ